MHRPTEPAEPAAPVTSGSRRRALTRPPADPRQWGIWARSIEGGPLLLLRAFLGVTFVVAGVQKLANPDFFSAKSPTSIQSQLGSAVHTTPFGTLIAPLQHVTTPLGVAIAVVEIAVGLGTLAGCYARLAALGGLLLSLSFFLTVSYNTSPYYYGSDIVFFFAWTTFVIGGAGALSLDAVFAERRRAASAAMAVADSGAGRDRRRVAVAQAQSMDRRLAMQKLASGGAIGALTFFIAGLTAAVGRALHPKNTPVAGGTGLTGTGAGSTGGTSPSGSTGSSGGSGSTGSGDSKPSGKAVLAASAVPVGGGHMFNDPANGFPGWALQPEHGEFKAFSAICTHLGCTVNFVPGVDQFQCPCHGSIYSASTGAVLAGPAPSPLPAIKITESGGELYAD